MSSVPFLSIYVIFYIMLTHYFDLFAEKNKWTEFLVNPDQVKIWDAVSLDMKASG
jgi:hypothetical protein